MSIVVAVVLALTAVHGLCKTLTFVNMQKAGHDPITVTIDEENWDVCGIVSARCDEFLSNEYCINGMDSLTNHNYGIAAYTPQLPHRTMEDYLTSRAQLVVDLIFGYQYMSYLEIGCDLDHLFSVVREWVPTAVGVDPARGGTLRMTSDEFFEQNTDQFDIIFIDGDHSAEQALKDLDNSLAVLRPGGTILMHDCNPRLESRQYLSDTVARNGDVWKVVALYRSHTDVEIVTVDVDHGVAVLRRRPNMHPLPTHLQQRIEDNHHGNPLETFTYKDLEQNRVEMLRLITVADLREWLHEEEMMHSSHDMGEFSNE